MQAIPRLYAEQVPAKNAAKSGEAPSPDTRIQINNIKFNMLTWLTNH